LTAPSTTSANHSIFDLQTFANRVPASSIQRRSCRRIIATATTCRDHAACCGQDYLHGEQLWTGDRVHSRYVESSPLTARATLVRHAPGRSSFYWFLTIVEQIASTSHHTPILLLRTHRFHILQQCDHPTSAPQSHKQGLPLSQMRLKPFHLYISLSMTVSSTIASMRILGLCTSGTCIALLFSYTKYWETQ
jgi:hypothetical protein